MSRLGNWEPSTLEARVDRIESLGSIRQLAFRYALAVDSRDMDALVALFVADVRVGRDAVGRDALRIWFTETLRVPKASVHFVGNHIIDFEDADHAHGIVYCRDELEVAETGSWNVGMFQYWDTYVRIDGEWFFERRRFHRWYLVDALTRPSRGAGVSDGTGSLTTHQLPEAFDSWDRFWEDAS